MLRWRRCVVRAPGSERSHPRNPPNARHPSLVLRGPAPPLHAASDCAKPAVFAAGGGFAYGVSAGHQLDARLFGQPGIADRFSGPAGQLPKPGHRQALPRNPVGTGAPVALHGGVASAAGHWDGTAGPFGPGPLAVAAASVCDSDGVAANCGGGDLEADLHPRHQPDFSRRQGAGVHVAGLYLACRLCARRHRRGRHLGVGALHLFDGAGRLAEPAR